MAKISIIYGKIKKDGGRAVALRLVAGNTQKHIPLCIDLERGDYKIYPDGRVKVTNDIKYFNIEDALSDLQKKMNEILRCNVGKSMTADELYAKMKRKDWKDVLYEDFFKFAEDYLDKSSIKGKKNYITMLNSLQRYNKGIRTLPFASITFSFLDGYCYSLKDKPRAQSLYLGEIRHLWKQACLVYNDDDNIVLSPTLFDRFKVPKQKNKGQRAFSLGFLRAFIRADVKNKREELAKDCCILSLCLMGTNSVDLYNAEKYLDGKLIYERTKTKDRRQDRAKIEIEVCDVIRPLFEKYHSFDGKHAFCFSSMYSNASQFNKAINIGLKQISKRLNADKIQFYQFRHTFASIARNELGISKSDIDDMLNHVGDNRIADIYIKKDFSIINKINKKVVDYIFQ